MAEKLPTPPTPTPTPVPPVPDAFSWDDGDKYVKPVKAASTGKGKVSDATKKLMAVPVGKSFLIEVKVPDAITDAGARNKWLTDELKAEKNRVTGSARRLVKSTKDTAHASKNFTIEAVASSELGYGVRVWRDEDTAAA